MSLDIVIPATRRTVNQLLWSLSQGTVLPDRVIVVTNEVRVESFTDQYPVDVIGFSSRVHPIGHADQALRRNIGIWESTADYVMTLDDDQFAPRRLVESALAEVQQRRVVWGHHRFIDFDAHAEALLDLGPESGKSREHGVNTEHLYFSCYAGLMVVERQVFMDIGGYDLMFLGRHGNEDQSLGRRINHHLGRGDKVWVSEPPFAWHPDRVRTHGIPKTNTCDSASSWMEEVTINGVKFLKCQKPSCPFRFFADAEERLFTDEVVIPYDPATVTLKKERT